MLDMKFEFFLAQVIALYNKEINNNNNKSNAKF